MFGGGGKGEKRRKERCGCVCEREQELSHSCDFHLQSAISEPGWPPWRPSYDRWPAPGGTWGQWRLWLSWSASQTHWWSSHRGRCGGSCGSLLLKNMTRERMLQSSRWQTLYLDSKHHILVKGSGLSPGSSLLSAQFHPFAIYPIPFGHDPARQGWDNDNHRGFLVL